METNPEKRSTLIREEARRLGFSDCGISPAGELKEDASRLKNWLSKGMQAGMAYMERNFSKRTNPRVLVPGARSVISVILNYFPSRTQEDPSAPRISRYAYPPDYHLVMKNRLHELLKFMKQRMGPVSGRVFVDSAPVLDRAWAARSGLGWIGKNTMLISRKLGSFIFIGEIICDLELATDQGIPDYCGSCTRCLDACPTGALTAPYQLDSRLCISYHTIENREEIPSRFRGQFKNWVFGCDICQDVCPWNLKRPVQSDPDLQPIPGLLEMSREEWFALDEESYRKRFAGSAIERTGYSGLKRNLKMLL